jgi:Ca2+-binding EF-hand superfamily protein
MRLVWLAVVSGLIATPALAQQQGGGVLAMLEAADANHDGAVTRAELQTARGVMFDRLDADHDGYISETERAAFNGRTGGQSRRGGLEGADANNDGRISRAEMLTQPSRGFDRLDRNHDDVVSAEEIQAARIFLQGR